MPGKKNAVLDKIRILDFSWVLAGPYATRLLADSGAEVIKIQPLLPEAEDKFSRGYYNTWNRNKLGITLNLSCPEGIDIVKSLVKLSDAVVENFTPRVMANWGLDYPHLKQLRPDIIMVSLSTMGNTGPQRDYTGFGPTVQALSGITHLTSFPGKPPLGPGFSYADHIAGLYASLALLGALEFRRKTGQGQYIDISEIEAMTSMMSEAIAEYGLREREIEEREYFRSYDKEAAAPWGVYPCRGYDRWIAISVHSEQEWQNLKKVMGGPEWAEESLNTPDARMANMDRLDRLIQAWTELHTAEEVMAMLLKVGIPSGIVQDARNLAYDPQLKSRDFFVKLEHPELGKTVSDASPIRLSGTPAKYRRAAPTRGQDNDYVYRKLLGMSQEEIQELKRQGVI